MPVVGDYFVREIPPSDNVSWPCLLIPALRSTTEICYRVWADGAMYSHFDIREDVFRRAGGKGDRMLGTGWEREIDKCVAVDI